MVGIQQSLLFTHRQVVDVTLWFAKLINYRDPFQGDRLSVTYFGLFDGHAGPDAALVASKLLHKHIQVNK